MVNKYLQTFITLSIIFLQVCISDNIEDLYDFDNGAWVLCRKLIEGANGNFGVGSSFTVTYELINIGTQKATNIKIQDSWDTEYFRPYNKEDITNILYEQKQLKPKESVSFSYYLVPLKTGNIDPSRANISYSVNDMMEEDDEDEFTSKTGVSSNWINTIDNALIDQGLFTPNIGDNLDNNQIIIISSTLYSRNTGRFWAVIGWVTFILGCAFMIIYPLCEYEANKGDFSFIPFNGGYYVKFFARNMNNYGVSKISQQISKVKRMTSGGSKKEN